MKWYNKDKTKMIDLSKLNSYEFIEKCRVVETTYPDRLKLNINGYIFWTQTQQETEEIYNLIRPKN